MPKQYIIEHWLLKHTRLNDQSLADTQLGQAYARLAFASAGLLYLMVHANSFSSYKTAFLTAASIYFLINLFSIPLIRRSPISVWRCLLFPVFDIGVVSFGMLIDGGQSSGIFFVYLVIILGNGFRFGNGLLLYSQVLSLTGMLSMLAYAHFSLQASIDHDLLYWQLGVLLVIPLYVHLIGQRAEEAVQGRAEAERNAFNLLNKGPLPVFTFKPDKTGNPVILYANSAVHETFQDIDTDSDQASVAQLVLPEDGQEMVNFCRDIFDANPDNPSNTMQHIYIRSRDKSGNILKLHCTAICMRWRQQWIGVCFMLDISDRAALQEELEAVHRQGYMSALVAGIVHDFRNVLTNMIGYAEVLQMNLEDQTARQQLESIIDAGDRGSELITHLLKLSKNGETESLPAHTSGNRIIQSVDNIIGLIRLQMPPHIKLVCQIDTPLRDVAIGMIEIEQILMNLINNAIQAIDKKGQIHIRINHDPQHALSKPDHPCLRLRVSDNGAGIPPDDLDKVFKPFWTSRADHGGTGLGLTMVQRIVKRHHGVIEVDSAPGKETRFTIYLPPYIQESADINEAEHAAIPNNPKPVKPVVEEISNCHVLLVDDLPDILKIHQAMLARLNHTSVVAENGQQALDIFLQEQGHFDLIITDFRMPVMDGLELVENIRKRGFNIPILMITAFGEDRQLRKVADYNVILINKPISMPKFRRAIAETIATASPPPHQ